MYPLLGHEEEWRLAALVQAGDMQARQILLTSKQRLVVSIAKNFRGRGLPVIDLVQEGNIGLIEAVRRFKPDLRFPLNSYAGWFIRQPIIAAIEREKVEQASRRQLQEIVDRTSGYGAAW